MARGLAASLVITLLVGCGQAPVGEPPVAGELEEDDSSATSVVLEGRGTFYAIRPDDRLCAAPECGGAFVRRVNFAETRCADGTVLPECYVAAVLLPNDMDAPSGESLYRGALSLKPLSDGKSYGVFDAAEVWSPDTLIGALPEGTFYRIEKAEILCVRAPCPSLRQAKLNSSAPAKLLQSLELDVGSDAQRELAQAAARTSGLLVVGSNKPKKEGLALSASQFYRRVAP
jgi:hypothetical protein